ncbi:SPRY domain-containing protein [Toxoplasma gondii VAND]|uniref:SPRY domain-containing protein n=1 Tax=Toxoplasma gondii VAND TaxID=933077 RepID=A0A086Q905_TOXGO|nr:SPRY domain-containing protein [Toxoplasma gondii VAND]
MESRQGEFAGEKDFRNAKRQRDDCGPYDSRRCPPSQADWSGGGEGEISRGTTGRDNATTTAPTGMGMETRRGMEAPRGMGMEAPRGMGVEAPRGMDMEAPRGMGAEAPRGMGMGTRRGMGVEAPRGMGVEACRTTGTLFEEIRVRTVGKVILKSEPGRRAIDLSLFKIKCMDEDMATKGTGEEADLGVTGERAFHGTEGEKLAKRRRVLCRRLLQKYKRGVKTFRCS